MKALVFHKPKHVQVDTVDDPLIEASTDAIIKITTTAICGSDLHIYNGFFPQARNQVLGHEFMGEVVEVGKDVTRLKKGDRVIVPFPIACGSCFFCTHQLHTHCENSNSENYGPEGGILTEKGAGLFGYTDLYGGYSGGQAEYVRVPYADIGPRKVPDLLTDEQSLFLTDIFPTGFAAIDWAQMKGGETVAVIGCGPVGIMAQKAAWLNGASRVIGLDTRQYRLDKAKETAKSETILVKDYKETVEHVRSLTDGRGADVCVDAVGLEADMNMIDKAKMVLNMESGNISAFKLALSAVRRGGTLTTVGVYATTYDNFPLGQMFEKGIMWRGGQVPVHVYIDKLLQLVTEGKVALNDVITHRMPLADAAKAYDIFNKKEDNCVKVVLKP
ncbi:MAG: dehydrogenase [Bacteroidetes bacterium]|jgi:threonine dehydrogenase-like Zn-dependent dehydrogenase|nr:dehydrogenase [Bacteroidota bacterium]